MQRVLVLKEIARGNALDALAFYRNGLDRPLIEILGMVHRPYKYDFGMRYLHKYFSKEPLDMIEELLYVADSRDVLQKLAKIEEALKKAVQQAKDLLK